MMPTLTRGLAPLRAVLSNGAVVIVQETVMTPAVTMSAVFHAGSIYEPEDLQGLASLTGRVMDRGTERREGAEIAQEAPFREAEDFRIVERSFGPVGLSRLGDRQ
jgi:predicted Zn-dependent peptidase